MPGYWENLIAGAGNESIQSFSEKASSLVKLTNKEIEEVIQNGIDHSKFAELMLVVNDAKISNQNKADQIRKVSGFAEIAVNLISKLT